jgi:hypothetical protein
MIFGPYISSILRLLLPAEHQADLAVAEVTLANAASPDARLVFGKVLLCAGKVKQARDVLRAAEATASDAATRALAGGYRLLADFADFGVCRDWGAGPPLEVARRWSLGAWDSERRLWSMHLPPLPTPAAHEVWFVTQIAPLPNELASARTPDETRPLYGRMVRAMQRVEAGELPEVFVIGTLLVHTLMLRLLHMHPQAQQFAARGVEYCRAAGSAVGEGLFALLADDIATTTRTTPEVLDLYAGDARSLSRSPLDALEEGPLPQRPADWTSVFHGQSGARTIFESQGWHIGVGAALVLAASWITRAKPADVTATFEIQHLAEAKSAFQRAADDAGTQLVQCRLLAAGIEQNFPFMENNLQAARDIGVWGREIGSFSFALGLGFLLLAFGRRWQRRGDFASALRAIELAAALFEGLQAPVASADAAMEEAELLAAGWESIQGIPALQRAFDAYAAAISTMGLPQPDYLDAWQELRGRLAQTGALLLAWSAGRPAFDRTRQRLLDLNVLPGMSS